MKTIIAFTHLINDSQILAVKKVSSDKSLKIIEMSTNRLSHTQLALIVKGSEIKVLYKGKLVVDPVLWFATNHRCDSIYALSSRFPNELRLSAGQFITDISSALANTGSSYPGKLSDILISDSKPILFSKANSLGLLTPDITINSTFRQKKSICSNSMYKKKLGYPTFISFDRDEKEEVIVETTNIMDGQTSNTDGLWQWQSPLESVAHIRCFAHKSSVTSKIWYRKSVGPDLLDMRQVNDGQDTKWTPFELPEDICLKINKLLDLLGLSFACPEFLLDMYSNLIFIDLNPCGDWIGFFDKKEEKDNISRLILDTLIQ
jgi:hypothetical protein